MIYFQQILLSAELLTNTIFISVGVLFILDVYFYKQNRTETPVIPITAMVIGGILLVLMGLSGAIALFSSQSAIPHNILIGVLSIVFVILPSQWSLDIGTSPSLRIFLTRILGNR
ncbi:hypothetical protein SAMN05421809_1247 [Natronorubrum daqingense]|uniref:Uncharacterized protein n=1 Tax=Natronorubrum daqingense TaxID=588898 RepID=A0A1N7APD1_9EURY|nr:hypothetical protein BB347_15575 [Natronorubrum daqingense]SIR40969.1 hypothetical protein SAMN05421809_1247 [Natronorubrum daqingense]